MSFFSRAWGSLKMSLGGLYQRLMVAAGAVALLVVNWFCRPTRRRSFYPRQGRAAQGTLQEALLGDASAAEGEGSAARAGSPEGITSEAQLSQPTSEQQGRDGAFVAAEDVIVQSIQPEEHNRGPPDDQLIESQGAAEGSGSQQAPAATAPVGQQPFPEEPALGTTGNPVDEGYLKSLLDQEFGPPKFAVPKPAPDEPRQPEQPRQQSSEDRSLQELLDQVFGPPKFAVPKQPAPSPGQADQLGGEADGRGSVSAAQKQDKGAAAFAPLADDTVAARRGVQPSAGAKRLLPEVEEEVEEEAEEGFMALTLTVTHGPAAGKVFVADDPSAEYKIGRLPDCSLQILDQEISGRHASVRWDAADKRWKLHDVGSLNGTSLAGGAIGRDYKVPGPEHPLREGDTVVIGSVTHLQVGLAVAARAAASAAVSSKRHHAAPDAWPELSGGSLRERSQGHSEPLSALAGRLPPPAALEDHPELGVRLCMHNQLGVDHKRMGQGCEDVPYWELPYKPYPGAGIICVFDGHHGSKAAMQAKEHLPAILRSKLLRRDGRQAPPLPPPPKPQQPEDEEEGLEEGYSDGINGDDMGEGGVDKAAEAAEEKGRQDGGVEVAESAAGAGGRGRQAGEQHPQQESGAGPVAARGPDGDATKESMLPAADDRGVAEAEASAGGAEEVQKELLPPPPAGPPLPPFLRGRDAASQQAVLKETFLQSDQYMSMEEGCTATVVLVEADVQGQGGWTLQSANVGDSSALLVNFSRGTWVKLSEDHRIASSVSERQRLALRGHTVRTRLYGLNISRMLGDRFLKEEDLGFLAEPYVSTQATVAAGDYAVLVVASDGLWDVLPEKLAAKMLLEASRSAASSLRHSAAFDPYGSVGRGGLPALSRRAGRQLSSAAAAASSSSVPADAPPHLNCQAVADLLLSQARQLRSKDDITVTVMEMGPHLRGKPQEGL